MIDDLVKKYFFNKIFKKNNSSFQILVKKKKCTQLKMELH